MTEGFCEGGKCAGGAGCPAVLDSVNTKQQSLMSVNPAGAAKTYVAMNDTTTSDNWKCMHGGDLVGWEGQDGCTCPGTHPVKKVLNGWVMTNIPREVFVTVGCFKD